jgi:hypothetical protein
MAKRGLLPTPTAGDAKGSGSRNRSGSKAHAGVILTDAVARGGSEGGPAVGRLNPSFVEWMMGFPAGWTLSPWAELPLFDGML